MRPRTVPCVAALVTCLGIAVPVAATAAAPPRPERIVMTQATVSPATARALIARAGGEVTREVPMIHAFGARLTDAQAEREARARGVVRVAVNAPMTARRDLGKRAAAAQRRAGTVRATAKGGKPVAGTPAPAPSPAVSGSSLETAFNASAGTINLWTGSPQITGTGVTVAVIDTGIAGDLPDFRTSPSDATSRVIASVVTNPYATTATDRYGHGTHVAGLIAGNGFNRPAGDPLAGRYAGAAPNADLVSIKASDDHGVATVLDVIHGLQFVADHHADYNIRVVNLSLESSVPQSARVDPLDAAVEAVWNKGVVVVAAAGNRGTASDAVTYAPGNDPYVISVGAVDDKGTKTLQDDALATWSSRGRTQDGHAKPDILAPGARLVSVLAPGSDFVTQCPSCIVSGQYIRLGGTSMSAAVTSGVVADMLQSRPTLTPDQVKAALMGTTRTVSGVGPEVQAYLAARADLKKVPARNTGLVPSTLIDPKTGDIDWTRASWSRASWSDAADPLRASWSRASWSCACALTATGTVDPTRASWSRASWSAAWDK